MKIRNARMDDSIVLWKIEAACFPKAEAASLKRIEERLNQYKNHFWIAQIGDEVIGFINGMVTDSMTIDDIMYEDARLHNENGSWQSVFGLDVIEEYRYQGYAAKLMEALIEDAKKSGRKGCVLTCKDHLVHYYEKFGYEGRGKSESVHGGSVWYDMVLTF